MKSIAAVAVAVLLPVPVIAQARAQTVTKTCPAASVAAVESQFDRFNAAWATGNPDTVAALFAPDATLLATVSNAERKTPTKIRAYFVDFLKGKPVGRIETSTVILDCETAKRSGNWVVNTTNANDERVDIFARYSFVYKWDGKDWKIQHLHSSVRPAVSPAS
jgi:uncharacterized protein (TIGR02246 family)